MEVKRDKYNTNVATYATHVQVGMMMQVVMRHPSLHSTQQSLYLLFAFVAPHTPDSLSRLSHLSHLFLTLSFS